MTESSEPSTQDTAEAIAQIREQWGAVIENMIAACGGNAEASARLAPFFDQMMQKEEWRALIAVLRRILAGERDALALLHGLDDTDTLIMGDVLRGLGMEAPTPTLPRSQDQRTGEGVERDDDGKMISLEDFLQQVVRACKPDAPTGLAEQMHAATRGMATQANLSPELRKLGRVLNQILSGERNPDLSALHPQLAEVVRQMLTELE